MGTVLKFDVDWKAPKEWRADWILLRQMILEDMFFLTIDDVIEKETTRGFHYYFRVKERITDEGILYLQYLLGDDYSRCKINYWRIERGIKEWNRLFSEVIYRKKQKSVKCKYCGAIIPIYEEPSCVNCAYSYWDDILKRWKCVKHIKKKGKICNWYARRI